MELTAKAIHGFTSTLLQSKFDDPKPTPEFHHELWELVTDPHPRVAISAPRGHAKSTAITHSFLLAAVLFRVKDYVLLLSGSEPQAIQFLSDVKAELLENEALKELFKIKRFVKDTERDIIVEFNDGQQFRIRAKGSGPEQKVRGLKWRNKRPNLIICDDMEDDEAVLNEERRFKFRQWFFNAVLPGGSDNCVVRVIGTILHQDSLLEKLMPAITSPLLESNGLRFWERDVNFTDPDHENYRSWKSVKYQAHNEDFSKILWKEKFSEKRLKTIRQEYIDQGFPEGYAQEYLNRPIDDSMAYFRKEDLDNPIDIDDLHIHGDYYVSADLAISTKDQRAFSVILVAKLLNNNDIHIVDVRRFRGDSLDIVEEIFSVQERYNPVLFAIEDENISKSIGPYLKEEMNRGRPMVNFHLIPTGNQDKVRRARSIQARVRAGKVKFNTHASWWPDFFQELVYFPKGTYRDQVDAFAYIGIMLDKMVEVYSQSELDQIDYEEEYDSSLEYGDLGINWQTGY